jgi:hypothetical protein
MGAGSLHDLEVYVVCINSRNPSVALLSQDDMRDLDKLYWEWDIRDSSLAALVQNDKNFMDL